MRGLGRGGSVLPLLLAVCGAQLVPVSCGSGSERDACPPSRFEGGAYHSQFYEDYVLSYVFEDLESGTYVDVGANRPDVGSVTKTFYDRGWRGINIDANPQFEHLYARDRPRDTNVFVGIAEQEGHLLLYKISDAPGSDRFEVAGMSTFDARIAASLRKKGFRVKTVRVPVMRLEKVLADHPMEEITFLNVDVEGFEREVLSSIDFGSTRPRVVMIEATYPMTRRPVHEEWERILLDAGYVFAMSDSLNRYYVDRAHEDLLPRFARIERCVVASQRAREQP